VIDTLIRAGASRYLEFKTIQHLYMQATDEMIQVPVSKADVFKSTNISLVEKRQLMKFIQTISHPDDAETELLAQMGSKPFVQYTKQKKLTERLTQFLLYAVALEPHHLTNPSAMTTTMGVSSILRFMGSLGRYGGNSPWIYPLFGMGDLCQSFSRLSAVYGATFILGKHVTELHTSRSGEEVIITGINVGTTKDIKTKHVVSSIDHLPELANPIAPTDTCLSRCVLITDGPMKTKEGTREIIFSVIPPNTYHNTFAVYILQLDESASVVPSGKYLLHIWTQGSANGVEVDLKPIVEALSRSPVASDHCDTTAAAVDGRPSIVYSAYWNHFERRLRIDIPMPKNLTIIDQVNFEVGADSFFEQAQLVFSQLCPGEEFIPNVPNPEDIIWVRTLISKPLNLCGLPSRPCHRAFLFY